MHTVHNDKLLIDVNKYTQTVHISQLFGPSSIFIVAK